MTERNPEVVAMNTNAVQEAMEKMWTRLGEQDAKLSEMEASLETARTEVTNLKSFVQQMVASSYGSGPTV